MIEVVAEVDLAGDEALEEIGESAVGEIVMPNESSRMMEERDRAIEWIACDPDVLRVRAPRHHRERQMRLDQPRLGKRPDRLRPDFLEMRKQLGQRLAGAERTSIVHEKPKDVLHPRRAALRIRRDEDIARRRTIAETGIEAFDREPHRHQETVVIDVSGAPGLALRHTGKPSIRIGYRQAVGYPRGGAGARRESVRRRVTREGGDEMSKDWIAVADKTRCRIFSRNGR